MAEQSKIVVIGAGLMGAATAWRLAQRGQEVTLVERARPAAPDASSSGSARIFRYAYPDPFYAGLVVRAREGYSELENIAEQQLISPTGALDMGLLRDPAGLAGVLDQVGVAHELLTAAQAQERFPQFRIGAEVLWHPDAGVIDSQSSVQAMVAACVDLGGQMLAPWSVTSVEQHGSGYRVHALQGEIEAEQVVVTVGGWLPNVLEQLPLPADPRSFLPRLEISEENAFHLPYREPKADWPTFIVKEEGLQAYGLPGGRDADFRGLKIAEFNAGRKMASATDQDGVIRDDLRRRIVDLAKDLIPGVLPEPYAETTCLFTNTRTEDFLLDRYEGITLVSACSGHGAKFAPLIGDLAADVVTGAAPPPDRFLARTLAAAGN